MCRRAELGAGEIGEGPSMVDLLLDCLRSVLALFRRIVEVLCRIVESVQARRQLRSAAGFGEQRVEDPHRGANFNCKGCSISETGSSSAAREIKIGLSKSPSIVSSRIRYGRWSFYAVRRGRTVGIFRTWPECEEHVKYYSGAILKGFNTEREANAFLTQPSLSMFREN